MPAEMLEPIIKELKAKKYVDDWDFARFWVENRRLKKGISGRRLREELLTKGVACDIIDEVLALSERADADEIKKIVAKKRKRYDDKQLMAYLVRQGFDYAIVKEIVQTDFAVPDGLKSGMD
jgi:regulatory protein